MNNNKKISIIIPTYKGESSLPIALQSVAEQTYTNIEVVVSDDNGVGTDDQIKTKNIIDKFSNKLNIIYLKNEHVNGSHARNKGLEVATGDYISFLDDDDFITKEYSQNVIDSFDKNKNIDILFFNVAIITKEGINRFVTNDSISYKDLLFNRKEIGTGSNICFRKVLKLNGTKFDERYLRHQDIEFMVKNLSKYKSIWVNKTLIVKYYNNIDNYLNYKKTLQTQELLRDDLKTHNLISFEEEKTLINIQLHSLFHDMLAKNTSKDDIKKIFSVMKQQKIATSLDRMMFIFYSLSKASFNSMYYLYMSKKTPKNNYDFNELLLYRDLLENNSR